MSSLMSATRVPAYTLDELCKKSHNTFLWESENILDITPPASPKPDVVDSSEEPTAGQPRTAGEEFSTNLDMISNVASSLKQTNTYDESSTPTSRASMGIAVEGKHQVFSPLGQTSLTSPENTKIRRAYTLEEVCKSSNGMFLWETEDVRFAADPTYLIDDIPEQMESSTMGAPVEERSNGVSIGSNHEQSQREILSSSSTAHYLHRLFNDHEFNMTGLQTPDPLRTSSSSPKTVPKFNQEQLREARESLTTWTRDEFLENIEPLSPETTKAIFEPEEFTRSRKSKWSKKNTAYTEAGFNTWRNASVYQAPEQQAPESAINPEPSWQLSPTKPPTIMPELPARYWDTGNEWQNDASPDVVNATPSPPAIDNNADRKTFNVRADEFIPTHVQIGAMEAATSMTDDFARGFAAGVLFLRDYLPAPTYHRPEIGPTRANDEELPASSGGIRLDHNSAVVDELAKAVNSSSFFAGSKIPRDVPASDLQPKFNKTGATSDIIDSTSGLARLASESTKQKTKLNGFTPVDGIGNRPGRNSHTVSNGKRFIPRTENKETYADMSHAPNITVSTENGPEFVGSYAPSKLFPSHDLQSLESRKQFAFVNDDGEYDDPCVTSQPNAFLPQSTTAKRSPFGKSYHHSYQFSKIFADAQKESHMKNTVPKIDGPTPEHSSHNGGASIVLGGPFATSNASLVDGHLYAMKDARSMSEEEFSTAKNVSNWLLETAMSRGTRGLSCSKYAVDVPVCKSADVSAWEWPGRIGT